jgi:hypothetical protein
MQLCTKLLSSTVLAAAMVLAVPTASAQDIGALEKRVKALEKAGGGRFVSRSKKTVSLTVSGHLYRAIQYRDNGTRSGYLSVQPQTAASRIRWIGVGRVNDDVTFRTNLEFAVGSGAASGAALGVQDANGSLTERHVDFTISSRSLGSINLGQGNPAQNGRYGSDLSGTGVVSLNGQSARLLVGGETFQNLGNPIAGKTVISVFSIEDEGRQDRIRYNTPRFGGFQLSVDHQNNDDWGVGAGYSASMGGVRIAANIGYQNAEQSSDGETRTIGSVSILLPMGLSLTAAAGESSGRSNTIADATSYQYGKVGYSFTASELGQTRLYVEAMKANEVATLNEEANFFSFGVVQIVEPLGAELVLAYHNIDLDLPNGAASDDINALTAAIRLSF